MAETNTTASGNPAGLRALAVLLWILALAFEVVALMMIFGNLTLIESKFQILCIPAFIIDLILAFLGSAFWKKANRIKPVSKKKPGLFWFTSNLGAIMCCMAFLPFILLLIKNKGLDKKTKFVSFIAGVVTLSVCIVLNILL